jgi:leader peptidase (prepilin peptidase)/N-methyltransferase
MTGFGWLGPLLMAPFIGSFMGVLILRLPSGMPVVKTRSVCVGCGATLAPRDLIPLLSFVATRGRCRRCGAPIGLFHPAIELAAVAVAARAALADPDSVWVDCGLGWTLLTLSWIDTKRFLLPDVLTLPLIVAGLTVTWVWTSQDLVDHSLAAALGYLSFQALAFAYHGLRGRHGLGGGDAKLIAAAGAWCGLAALPLVVLGSALAGLLAVLGLALAGRTVKLTTRIPFGPCIAAAFWLVWMHGPAIDALIRLLGDI